MTIMEMLAQSFQQAPPVPAELPAKQDGTIMGFLQNLLRTDPRLAADLASRVKTRGSVLFPPEEVLQGEASGDPSRMLRSLLGGQGILRMRALPSKVDPLVTEGLINPVSYKTPNVVDLSTDMAGTTLNDMITKGVLPHTQGYRNQDILDALFSVLKSQRKPLK